MKFSKLNNPNKFINVNITKYLIDWDRKVSKPQKKVKDFLYPFWKNHTVLEEFVIPGSRKRIDLLNIDKNIIIEVSPEAVHTKFNKFMHGNLMEFLKKMKADLDKEQWAEDNNFTFIELNDEDLKLNLNKEYFEANYKVYL